MMKWLTCNYLIRVLFIGLCWSGYAIQSIAVAEEDYLSIDSVTEENLFDYLLSIEIMLK